MKKLGLVSLLLATSLIFTGCGSKKEDANSKVSGVIKVVTNRTDAEELYAQIESDFIKKYPEVEDIIWESSSDYDNYITMRMNTKDYGDVLFVPFSMNGNPSEYQNYFESLGTVSDLDKKYVDVTEASYEDKVYGLPTVLNSLGIVYNEEVFKKAGITEMPKSTEEFIQVCKTIKEKTGVTPFFTNYKRLGVWGGALSSYAGNNFKADTLEKGSAFEEGQPIREVMDLFYQLASNALVEEDPVTGDQAKAYQMIADGNIAMMMTGSQDVPTIQELNKDNTINIMPFPVELNGKTSIAIGASSVIGINKNSENKATAKAFLEFFISSASGYAKDSAGMTPNRDDLTAEEKKKIEENNVVLTAPPTDASVVVKYTAIASEVGVGRIGDALQKVINIGLYPDKNQSYSEYVNELETSWKNAAKANE